MALAELHSVSSPGQVAEARSIISDQVNIGSVASNQRRDRPAQIMGVAVVLLDHDVVRGLGIRRMAVLRVDIAPGRPLNRRPNAPVFEVEHDHAVRRILCLTVAEKPRRRQSPAVGRDRRQRVDVTGVKAHVWNAMIEHHQRLALRSI